MSTYLVFDWGGTFMKYALMNENARILEKGKVTSPGKKDSREIFFSIIDEIVGKYPGIEGIAISSPGIINSEKGVIDVVGAFPYLQKCADLIRDRFPGIEVDLIAIRNRFFGEQITVSGLITGQDLLEQLSGRELGSRVLIPINMLRSGEEVFLDDMTVSQIQKALQVPVVSVKSSGYDLVGAVAGIGDLCQESDRFRPYEPSDQAMAEPESEEN